MTGLYYAHSGLRYLVLLAGAAALVVFALGYFGRRPYGRGARITGAAFTGLLHIQVLLGVTLVALGRWYPALAGHLMMMLLAAVATPVATGLAKRSPDPQKAHGLALAGTVVALLLIVGGIMAIGRGVFESQALDATVSG